MGRRLDKYYQTFSGADMVVHMIFPDASPIVIGECSTVTYSTYREKTPVRTLGSINVRGFAKGPRTIAGTLIFTVFQTHIVNRIRCEVSGTRGDGYYLKNLVKIKPDELPPFDIAISLGNEYGSSAWLGIFGITVVDEGKVFSIEDMFTENQWSYMARDLYLMDHLGHPWMPPIIHTFKRTLESSTFDPKSLILDKDFVKMQEQIQNYIGSTNQANQDALNRFLEQQNINAQGNNIAGNSGGSDGGGFNNGYGGAGDYYSSEAGGYIDPYNPTGANDSPESIDVKLNDMQRFLIDSVVSASTSPLTGLILRNSWDAIEKGLSDALTALFVPNGSNQSIADSIHEAWNYAWGRTKDTISELVDSGAGTIANIQETINNAWNGIGNSFRNAVTQGANAATDFFDKKEKVIQQIIDSLTP